MRHSKLLLLGIVILCIGSLGCKKQSRKWLVGEVHVFNGLTGEPIQTKVVLDYRYNPMIGQLHDATRELGTTNSQGRLVFEDKVSRRNVSYTLKVHKPLFYGDMGPGISYEERKLNVTSNNKLSIALFPKYPYLLRVVNTNCMAPTDSLWISDGEYTREAYGCADSSYQSFSFPFTKLNDENQITLNVTTKKNGIVQTFSETHNLLPAEIVPITINY